MEKGTKGSLGQLRLVMMLFMLIGLFGPMVQSAGAQSSGLVINGQLCFTLDTTAPFLFLSDVELQVLAGASYNASAEVIAQVKTYCQDHPSKFQGTSGQKVFVCKYVGTPNVDERLQTGNNPISVSVNAIPDYQGIGSFFADAQGRSFVLAEDTRTGGGQTGEPSVDQCPAPDGPDNPPVAKPPVVKPPVVNPPVVNPPVVNPPVVNPPVVNPPVNPPKESPPANVAPAPAKQVTGMPSTGSGSANSENLMFAALGIATLALVAFGVRREPVA